jgi:hypothetical protein
VGSIVNIVTDVGILALPIWYILPLRLTVARRIQVCGIFLLSSVVCVFGVVRTVVLAQAPAGNPSYKYCSVHNVPPLTNLSLRQSGVVWRMVLLRNRYQNYSCLPTDPCHSNFQITPL